MNEIITQIFQLYGYYRIENSEVELFKSKSIDDYWLVYNGEPKTISHEFQSELLNQCKKACKERALEKNLNLLCLWQVDNIDHSTISELHYLEEDIHYFKKHVLYFTLEEFQSLTKKLEEESISELFINSPTNIDVFNRYKPNINNNTWESLLYRICIKLTFMPIECEEGEDISNLHTTHEQNLINEAYLNILDDITQNLDEKYLEGSPEDLLNTISSSVVDKL
jgi:lantibiotic modifying enzyme